MGYSFEMLFIEAESKAAAYEKAENFVSILMEPATAQAWIKENLLYFLRCSGIHLGDSVHGAAAYHLEDWLSTLFTVRFTYWPEHNLLGVLGGKWPKACMDQTSNCVLFQNGCDQDYEFELWPKLPFFQKQIQWQRR